MNNSQKLKKIRRDLGLTRREVREMTGYSQGAISSFLREDNPLEPPDRAIRLLELELGLAEPRCAV